MKVNGERNGKGKEYYQDNWKFILKYEGEYLDGKRNENGKEYRNDDLIKFEGKCLYNYRIKGKFYINEKLEYEGEFSYNKKWYGKGFDENDNIIYELINGNGKVKEFDDNGKLFFEGEYLNGKRNGKGKEYDKYGRSIYEGEYLNGKRNGKGK